jgi:D-hexose-6-phosphate mutarotase
MLKIAPHTAQVISFLHENHDLFYLSPFANLDVGKSIRGGVPIIWPWFAHKEGERFHGFARNASWDLIEEKTIDNKKNLKYKLHKDAIEKYGWNQKAELIFEIISGKALEMNLITKNTGASVFQLTQALHSYFLVDDINHIEIEGLDGIQYYDKVLDKTSIQANSLKISSETDRIYQTSIPVSLLDPGFKRKLVISSKGSNSTVIWNPWEENIKEIDDMPDNDFRKMICIEAANTHLDPISLPPGKTHVLSQKIEILPL